MNTDLKDKQRKYRMSQTFKFAIEGMITCVIQERNFRIHIFISILVIAAAILLSISKTEWILILIAIGGMMVLEMMNSAIERVVDLVTNEYHPLAKQAKDIAAGAVLIYALLSVIIGIMIFGPKIYILF
ncbi:diacylglycerol kinase family protein [Neobacillus sp. D3-1R]|uniref:diacylglycerol kinase family protein n=1 Tax=Neobacillus sp. D3-1R TaxID=3445778 RepID=UPI003F9FD26C